MDAERFHYSEKKFLWRVSIKHFPFNPTNFSCEKSLRKLVILWMEFLFCGTLPDNRVFPIAGSLRVSLFIKWGGAEDLGKRFGCFMIIRWPVSWFFISDVILYANMRNSYVTIFAEFNDNQWKMTVGYLKYSSSKSLTCKCFCGDAINRLWNWNTWDFF